MEAVVPPGGVAHWLIEHRHELLPQNRWILSRLQALIPKVERGFAQFELNESAQALYEFSWHEFCDWYIELSKLPFREGGASALQSVYTLHYVLETLFRLMHPIMPFVTEELWQSLPWKSAATTPARERDGKPRVLTLMLQSFPKPATAFSDHESESTISALKAVIEALRNFRGENGISPKVEFTVSYKAASPAAEAFLRLHAADLQSLARVTKFERVESTAQAEGQAVIPLTNPPVELRISLQGLVNVAEEGKRLQKEIEKISERCRFRST